MIIGGFEYKIGKLPLFKQLHVSRKIAPVVWASGFSMVEAFAEMQEADIEYVINACLDAVERKQGEGLPWSKLGSLRALQFDDISLLNLYEISASVIKESLGNFFPEMLSLITGNPKAV